MRTTKVKPSLSLQVPSDAVRAHPVAIRGTLSDEDGPMVGKSVIVSRTDLAGTTSVMTTVGADSTWSVSDPLTVGGRVVWTATYPGDAGHQAVTYQETTHVERASTSLRIAANHRPVRFHDAVKLSIHLGKTYNLRTVTIWQDKGGDNLGARQVSSRKVDADGNVSLTIKKLSRTTTFSARFAGDYRYEPRSAHVKLGVHAHIALTMIGFAGRSGSYYVYRSDPVARVHVRPLQPGGCNQVRVQRYSGAWRTVAALDCLSLDSSSTAYVRFVGGHPHGVRFRIHVHLPANPSSAATTSTWRYFTYR